MKIGTSQVASKNRQSGFTLFEILVVLTIIAVSSGAVVVLMNRNSSGIEIRSKATQLAIFLREARTIALFEGKRNDVVIDVKNRTVKEIVRGKKLNLSTEISMNVTTAGSRIRDQQRSAISFFNNGSSTGGVIELKQNEWLYEIRVNWLTGRVSLSSL